MRVSEALGLRWRDIDLVEGVLRISGQLAPLERGETPYTVQTKSRRGVREMPFLPVVRETLEAALATELAAGRGQTNDFVFVTREAVYSAEHQRAGYRGGRRTCGSGRWGSRPSAPAQPLHVHGGV